MIPAILATVAGFVLMLIIMSYKDYKAFEVKRRINRMLIRQPKKQFSMFQFLGNINKRLTDISQELIPGIDADMFILYILYLFAGILAVSGIIGHIGLGIAIDVAIMIGVAAYLNSRRSKYIFKLEQQFGAFTRDIATYLHASPSLFKGIETVSKNTPEPLKNYLNSLIAKVESGEPLDKALHDFANEMNIESTTHWVDSITFARMTKSDLTDVCENTADRINRKLIRSMNIRATLSKTKGMVLAILCIIIFMTISSMVSTPATKQLFLNTLSGQTVLMYVVISLFATTYIIFNQIDNITKR